MGMFGQPGMGYGEQGFLEGEPAPGGYPETVDPYPAGWDPWEVGGEPTEWGPGTEYEWQPEVGVSQWSPSEELLADPEYQRAYSDLIMREQLGEEIQGKMGSMELTQVTDPRTGETRWEWSPVEQMATRQAGVYGGQDEYTQAQQEYEGQEAARQERMGGILEMLGYSPDQMRQARIDFQNQWQGATPGGGEAGGVPGGVEGGGAGGMGDWMQAYNRGWMTPEMMGDQGMEGWQKVTYGGADPTMHYTDANLWNQQNQGRSWELYQNPAGQWMSRGGGQWGQPTGPTGMTTGQEYWINPEAAGYTNIPGLPSRRRGPEAYFAGYGGGGEGGGAYGGEDIGGSMEGAFGEEAGMGEEM